MKPGTILFVVLVVGYLGLEGYVASRTKYRMEPDYIYQQFAEAARAVERCGGFETEVRDKFASNYRYTRRRAAKALAEAEPARSDAGIARYLGELEQTARTEVDAMIDTRGCKDSDVRQLLTRFKNRARLNLPTGE